MSKKKPRLGYDGRGGVLAVSRGMRESITYESMPATAKVLMDLLQMQWRNDKPVSYGIREASAKINCSKETTTKAFNMLIERGFIICSEQSLFNSRTGSKTREWRLTWMPFNFKNPTHEWEKWKREN
jgi:hypothetical protein